MIYVFHSLFCILNLDKAILGFTVFKRVYVFKKHKFSKCDNAIGFNALREKQRMVLILIISVIS